MALSFPWLGCLPPLALCVALIALKPAFAGLRTPLAALACIVYAVVVVAGGVSASPLLRGIFLRKLPLSAGAAKL